MRLRHTDHIHFPVMEAAGVEAIGCGHILGVMVSQEYFPGCLLAQRSANLARRNQNNLRAKRFELAFGGQQLFEPGFLVVYIVFGAGKDYEEEGRLKLVVAKEESFAGFIGDLKIRRAEPILVREHLRLDAARLVTDGESAQEVDDVPTVVVIKHVAKAWHRSAGNAMRDPPIEIAGRVQGGMRGR